jgi:hypothetical protein
MSPHNDERRPGEGGAQTAGRRIVDTHSTALGVAIPWASVPAEAMVPDNDTITKAAALKLPDELEARLVALEQAIVCPWACGASCPWREACEVTR